MLQPRLHDPTGEASGAVQVQVPLVLLRRVRGMLQRGRSQHVQLIQTNKQTNIFNLHFFKLKYEEGF